MKIEYPIIGLEIHVELKTKSKMFCQCKADYFGQTPNSHVCPVCLGMPGALPVPNQQAIDWTIKIAQALNCTIPEVTKFDRKHYFYPDLPKGYQISQYDEPIGQNGHLEVSYGEGLTKTFRLRRVHLEEDTGKLIHAKEETNIDFNRSSVPLVEIVTEADFHSSDDVKRFLEELQVIIRALGVANADMEKGDMRLEPNISVLMLEEGEEWDEKTFPPYKVEVKNINSFRFAKNAIDFELERQGKIVRNGEVPAQETRGYSDKIGGTVSQRIKEEAADYRYFPEPDIPPLRFSAAKLAEIKASIPELPNAKLDRYVKEFGIKYSDAFVITRDVEMVNFFETMLDKYKAENAQKIANAIINKKVTTPEGIAALFVAKNVDSIAVKKCLVEVISANPKVVEDYKAGKENSIMFLVGQVMKQMKGQADAMAVRKMLEERLV